MTKERNSVPLFSLREAAERRIERMYQPNWACKMDHLKIDLMPGNSMGPWVHLYSPHNDAINGRDPVDLLAITGDIDVNARSFYAYMARCPTPMSTKRQHVNSQPASRSEPVT